MAASITSITGLQNLPNLENFFADWNSLATVNLSGLSSLKQVDISDSEIPGSEGEQPSLTSVNVTGCTALEELRLDDNDFSAGIPNLTGLTNLTYLDLDQCNISGDVDLSPLTSLISVDLSGNNGITSVVLPVSPLDNVNIYDCSLTETAVNDILVELETSGVTNGYVDLTGADSAVPTGSGITAKNLLINKGWTVRVNQGAPGSVGIAPSTDFDIVGDFTIEMFVNMSNSDGFPRPYSFGAYPAPNAMSIEGGSLYFWANGGALVNGSFSPNLGQWYHICVMGSGSTVYMFIDGSQVATSPYGGSISSQGLPLTIGDGNEPNSAFNGLMNNFRWTSEAVYNTAGFTVPTSPLTDLTNTKLLIFQGTTLEAQLTDNSGNSHNATNVGATFSTSDPFNGPDGSLQMGNG